MVYMLLLTCKACAYDLVLQARLRDAEAAAAQQAATASETVRELQADVQVPSSNIMFTSLSRCSNA
jgi:hypothetical protein